jgi:hypothetical protein
MGINVNTVAINMMVKTDYCLEGFTLLKEKAGLIIDVDVTTVGKSLI